MAIARRTITKSVTTVASMEERVNCITHGAGLALSMVGMHELLRTATCRGTVGHVVGMAIFGGSMVMVYLASTLYHAVHDEKLKKRLQTIDHAAIYVLIAGTYTPFLQILPQPWPTWILTAIWCLAFTGVLLKTCFGPGHSRLSVTGYLAIGWFGIVAIRPLLERVPPEGVICLGLGGMAYSIGTIFFVWSNIKYSHAIWHMFVVAGSALHFAAVILYVVPLTN